MSWVAVGVGGAAVVGGVTSYLGAGKAAGAAQKAARMQAEEAARTRAAILNEGGRIEREAMDLSEATPQELAALERSYGAAEKSLAREEKLLAAIDPALMEASNQALQLLRGESSPLAAPVMKQRANQRAQLLNSLRAQYGPGAESSSIGQRALQSFDAETNNQSMGVMGQLFSMGTQDLGGRYQRGISGLQQVGQGYSALQERKLNTRLNVGNSMLGALSGTSQQMIQSAGAPYVGAGLQGQSEASLGNSIMNTGATLGAAYLGRKT